MANHFDNQNSDFKYHDFQKFWKVFPVKRSIKEGIKNVLFNIFPFFFNDWAVYQNWKFAKVFFNKSLGFWHKKLWKRLLHSDYEAEIIPNHFPMRLPDHQNSLAILIHAFYPEIFDEIIRKLEQAGINEITLYVTTPKRLFEVINTSLSNSPFKHTVVHVENHGRDILPFLKILPLAVKNGHDIILKLHTKSSNHLNRKDHWRSDLFEKLIGGGRIQGILKVFRENPSIGMVGPAGNILPMRLYYGANGERVHRYSKMMGANDDQLSDLNFMAGSMFYARTDAMLPLLKLRLTDKEFEPEAGQTDGTMAHVVERLFSVSNLLSGLQLADTNFNPSEPKLTVSKNHRFTL